MKKLVIIDLTTDGGRMTLGAFAAVAFVAGTLLADAVPWAQKLSVAQRHCRGLTGKSLPGPEFFWFRDNCLETDYSGMPLQDAQKRVKKQPWLNDPIVEPAPVRGLTDEQMFGPRPFGVNDPVVEEPSK
jgi:hypothetical protein